jgi:poly-gamma-glutamate capsule biosynthesis protein CapA/YwtB (metallophosphatase superfamily)
MKTGTPSFSVVVTGDICPFGALQEALLNRDVAEIIAPAASLFARADLVIGNLEIPLCEKFSPIHKFGTSPHFMAKPAIAAVLKRMGFGILTLANNHIMDQGVQGLQRTLHALAAAGISTCGAGLTHADACNPAVFKDKNRTLAVFNFAEGGFAQAKENGPGSARLEPFWSASRIIESRQQYDLILVILHLGNEYLPIPSDVTVSACRAMAHAGADAVIAHHPHIPLCSEIYEGVPICYSLGNFLFGPRENPANVMKYSPGWYISTVARLVFSDERCILQLHPFKQQFNLSLGFLSEQGNSAFHEYADLGRAIVADSLRHQKIWDQEARNLFRGFSDRLKNYVEDFNSGDPHAQRRAAAILHELFRTDAHHAATQRGLRLICEQREHDDPEAQTDLKKLYGLLRASLIASDSPS